MRFDKKIENFHLKKALPVFKSKFDSCSNKVWFEESRVSLKYDDFFKQDSLFQLQFTKISQEFFP